MLGPTLPNGPEVFSAAFTSDGAYVAISDDDGVSVFDTTSGARVARPEHPGTGWIVVSGGLMAITTQDGRVMQAACRMASRSLTQDEWDRYIGDLAP